MASSHARLPQRAGVVRAVSPALFNTTPAALPWAAVLLSVAGLLDAAATVRTARAISSDPLQ